MTEMMMKRQGRIPNLGDLPSSVFNRVLFFCKVTIPSSNMLVHELASRFGPALRLSGRSWAESAVFEISQLNPGSTLVHLGESVQWVNQPMVHLVNRRTMHDQMVAAVEVVCAEKVQTLESIVQMQSQEVSELRKAYSDMYSFLT
ncbi:hypothetical protein PIB30_037856 [Stylosanthes scabra]|uniref:Uncharacterized protein n=1 Tax=Stylosanthes scabra TaxID=79078 RepID=A0ABU6VCC4_9FABA|nr:hypothetical protein [Stylosanthes scabra]